MTTCSFDCDKERRASYWSRRLMRSLSWSLKRVPTVWLVRVTWAAMVRLATCCISPCPLPRITSTRSALVHHPLLHSLASKLFCGEVLTACLLLDDFLTICCRCSHLYILVPLRLSTVTSASWPAVCNKLSGLQMLVLLHAAEIHAIHCTWPIIGRKTHLYADTFRILILCLMQSPHEPCTLV